MKKENSKLYLSNKGMVTTDFLFSFILVSMFTALLFAMCYSFTIVEVTQYIAYSASRAAISGNKTFSDQRARAQSKVDELLSNPVFAPLLKNGWFNVTVQDMKLGQDPSDYYSSPKDMSITGSPSNVDYYLPDSGVRLRLEAKVLEMNLGLLGKIESETGKGFALTVGSKLFREPNQDECHSLIKSRYQRILELDDLYQQIAGPSLSEAVPMEDAGC